MQFLYTTEIDKKLYFVVADNDIAAGIHFSKYGVWTAICCCGKEAIVDNGYLIGNEFFLNGDLRSNVSLPLAYIEPVKKSV